MPTLNNTSLNAPNQIPWGQQFMPPWLPPQVQGNAGPLFNGTPSAPVPPAMPLWSTSGFPPPEQPQWPWSNPQGMNPPPNQVPAAPPVAPPPAANNPAAPPVTPEPPAVSPIQAWFGQFAQNALPNNPPPAPPAGSGDPALLAQLPPQPPSPPRPAGPAVFSQGSWHSIPPGVDPWVAQFDADQNRLPGVPAPNTAAPGGPTSTNAAPGFFGGLQQAASNALAPVTSRIGQAMDSTGPQMRQFGGTRSLSRQLTNHLASRS